MEDERRSRVFNGNVYSIIRSPVAVRQSNISDKKYMHNNTAALLLLLLMGSSHTWNAE